MDNIYETIYQARISLLKRNETPMALYLGYQQMDAVRADVKGNGAFTQCHLTVSGRNQVFGMDIFEVDAENHLRVV